MRAWLPPHHGTLELYGQALGDFVAGPGNGFLASEKFVEAFRSEGLTGLSGFHPVEVRVRRKRKGPKPTTVPRYFFVMPAYGSAAVDEARSRILRTAPITCSYCRETGANAMGGFELERGSWQGEDVFFARGVPGPIIVSERFERWATRHALTNMLLIPSEQYVWDPLSLLSQPAPPVDKA
jgi:hypothetical protein